jgi:hypothetical protein
VSVNPAQPYVIDVYRMGWYGGLGGRLHLHVALNGVRQPPCGLDASTGLIECTWESAYTLTVPADRSRDTTSPIRLMSTRTRAAPSCSTTRRSSQPHTMSIGQRRCTTPRRPRGTQE